MGSYLVPDQTGRRFIVTGSNSGTGKEAAMRLAAAGAQVVLAVRTPAKGEAAREEILAATPGADVEISRLDLADLGVVRDFAERELADPRPLHVLVNNAGVMVPPERILTAQGHELQWGSNFLGPFALTNLLLPKLLRAESPRVVTMSSAAARMGGIHFDDLDWERRYRAFPAYAQSKLANLLAGLHLARVARERGWSLRSTVAHPGYTETNLQKAGPSLGSGRPTLMSTVMNRVHVLPTQQPDSGAEPMLMAAVDPRAENGSFWGPSGRLGMVGPGAPTSIFGTADRPSLGRSLWAVAEDLTGTTLPE